MSNIQTSVQQELETNYLARNDLINRWGNVISSYLMLPGLVGFWPLGSVYRSSGNAADMSGQFRNLTYNGNPTYNLHNNFVPYIHFDGTGDYLSRGDETDLDVLGTETIYEASLRGLTIGGWFRRTADAGNFARGLICKETAVSTVGYNLYVNVTGGSANLLGFYVDTVGVTGTILPLDTWTFVCGAYDPSTFVRIYKNGAVDAANAVGIPASIANNASQLNIGNRNTGIANGTFTGDACLCFLCANLLPDALINARYQQDRVLFGV